MKYLLDTNILRELGKTARHKNVSAWLRTVDDSDLAISASTVREMAKGVARLRARKPDVAGTLSKRTATILAAFDGRILPVDRAVAEAWGEALAASERHIDDAGLGATAQVHGLTLVTRNTRDFARRGIALLNPYKSPPERFARS